MYILCEQPWAKQQVGFLARKDGKYTRPIIGYGVDFRIEDMGIPQHAMPMLKSFNFIGKLPNIGTIGQINKFFVCTHGNIISTSASKSSAMKLLYQKQHILLPHSQESVLWQYTQSPWWEYCMVLDEYFECIKAPKIPRPGEPTPDEIDEQLDNFKENQNTVHVVSPIKLKEFASGIRESYLCRLRRI